MNLPSIASLRYVAANVFIMLNLTAIGAVNFPPSWAEEIGRREKVCFGATNAFRLRYCGWMIRHYAHIVGLDSRWQMFGRQGRFNWWYVVRAEYGDEKRSEFVTLPIPSQSVRSLPQRWLFDLKENKILLNMYKNEFARETYSRYLARKYPEHNGMKVKRILWELAHQKILLPDIAVKKQKLREDKVHIRSLNRFELPGSPTSSEITLAAGKIDS